MAAQFGAGLQQPHWRFFAVDINLGIALIAGNNKVVLIRQLNQKLKLLKAQRGAGRVAWRTQEQQLAVIPYRSRDGSEVRVKTILFQAWQKVWLCTSQISRAFVDLVERVRRQHQRICCRAVNRCLSEGKNRFAGTVYRNHLSHRINRLQIKTLNQPVGDAFAQFWQTLSGRVIFQTADVIDQRLLHKSRRRMFRFTDRQSNMLQLRVSGYRCLQFGQLLEGIGL